MASSPEDPTAGTGGRTAGHTSADGDVRWPLVAKIGLALAVLTVTAGIVAALVAAFVIER